MKKLVFILLCTFMSVSLVGCGSSSDEKTETKPEEPKLTQAQVLQQENPELYEEATMILTELKTTLDFGLEDLANINIIAEYPYIDLYLALEKTGEVMVTSMYSLQSDTEVGINCELLFNETTKKLMKVNVSTTDAASTQEAIVFALVHLDGLTNSTDVDETLALKEVLEKTDESTASYDVAGKWTTLKVIGDSMTNYTVAIKE